ncbi:MAG: 2-isopropylmalate synthase [bacterium]
MKTKHVYRPFAPIQLCGRQWPDRTITKAPIWCSVDLRDGNQSLPNPMTVDKKIEMFKMLVGCGFKEIEVGFPAASPTEFEFVRRIIEEKMVPDDVTIQVLVQAREDLIKETVDSLVGAKRVIIHLYNSTSPAQRRVVFGLEKPDIVKMAIAGTEWVKREAARLESAGTDVVFQYSPESFSSTEVEFSLEICQAVVKVWRPTLDKKMILNLPETVEVATPNIYADQIEWFCRNIGEDRNNVIISVHTHNDRGTGVAATELGLLAGAERVEGTLFGNGERTGNLDIVTVALNLFTQGIDPMLDFSNLEKIRLVYEKCTEMTVPDRQPYSGELVFTAFSGSHQDAIRKGLIQNKKTEAGGQQIIWDVPYLIIDPNDIGRYYDKVIRLNGQSGKGGVAYILEANHGICLPKDMQREFGPIAGEWIDALGREVTSQEIKDMFWREYVEMENPVFRMIRFDSIQFDKTCRFSAEIYSHGEKIELSGEGNGPINAFIKALHFGGVADVNLLDYHEHALGEGSEASAITYICLQFPDGGIRWGVGVDGSIELASVNAVLSALNREG